MIYIKSGCLLPEFLEANLTLVHLWSFKRLNEDQTQECDTSVHSLYDYRSLVFVFEQCTVILVCSPTMCSGVITHVLKWTAETTCCCPSKKEGLSVHILMWMVLMSHRWINQCKKPEPHMYLLMLRIYWSKPFSAHHCGGQREAVQVTLNSPFRRRPVETHTGGTIHVHIMFKLCTVLLSLYFFYLELYVWSIPWILGVYC